jgi:hypothetical protein
VRRLDRDGGLLVLPAPAAGEADHLGGGVRGRDSRIGGRRGGDGDGHRVPVLLVLRLPDDGLLVQRGERERGLGPPRLLPRQPPLALPPLRNQDYFISPDPLHCR